MDYVKAFVTGGAICVIGQILIDKTKLTSARILVLFVVVGCILGALGIYEKVYNFGGAGASVPLSGFGYLLSKGVYEETEKNGILGIFTGGLKACSGGVSVAVLFSMLAALIFEPKDKK
ncbi:MAG: stage V sporulation protein AE [Clostridia bacterium]|nr:stage V sporulation protein AE [Clostridia bacterium]MCI1959866.1 stage V sporulation protein AE [Clostridia bacterium]MCI2000307.1 stage V sporulation protein AE [Clostridia bacterium]MCI2015487.1 stage V sporulation protein AE [Clostridia bacterium]